MRLVGAVGAAVVDVGAVGAVVVAAVGAVVAALEGGWVHVGGNAAGCGAGCSDGWSATGDEVEVEVEAEAEEADTEVEDGGGNPTGRDGPPGSNIVSRCELGGACPRAGV